MKIEKVEDKIATLSANWTELTMMMVALKDASKACRNGLSDTLTNMIARIDEARREVMACETRLEDVEEDIE